MKSQDVGLLLKLISLSRQEKSANLSGAGRAWPLDWEDWGDPEGFDSPLLRDEMKLYEKHGPVAALYTARALERETGISKSQINVALNRCYDIGLAKKDRRLDVPRVNTRALVDFIIHGLKYVFPAKPKELSRGIATGFSAPVLEGKLMSAGEFALVWPDAQGNTKGQAVEALFKSATFAVRRDPEMYALLALVDAIRVGQPREANLARNMLEKRIGM